MFRNHFKLLLTPMIVSAMFAFPAMAEEPAAAAAEPTATHASAPVDTTAAAPIASEEHAKDAQHKPHWDYYGDGGPINWGKLKEEFKPCEVGQFQSPIDLKPTINANLPALELDYKPAPLTILNNGHTIQVNYPEGSKLVVDGKTFNLLQFHFHTPSEYAINGKRSAMEVHFVHKDAAGNLGVVGVMIEKGKENPVAKAIFENMPKTEGPAKDVAGVTINPLDLFPANREYYRLMGSLTTPPCSEGVHWHVLKTPIQFSDEQIKSFQSLFAMNARPLQEQGKRLIVLDK